MKVKSDHRTKFSNLNNWKEEAWKYQGFKGIRTRDLRDTGAMLGQLSCEATHWERGQFVELISSRAVKWCELYCLVRRWHNVQRYCCVGVLFAHAQVPSNSSSYHIRGNEMNCVGSSEYMTVFTSFTRASFLNMRVDQSSSWLIRASFPKSTIL